MNNIYPQEIYKTSDVEELQQKIQHRFIRDVVKPYSNSIKKPPHLPEGRYRIPKSSEYLQEKIIVPQAPIERYVSPQNRRVLNKDIYNFTPLRSPIEQQAVQPQEHTGKYTPSMVPLHYPSAVPLPSPVVVNSNEIIIDCRQVHGHASSCPVCSKIYRSNYSIFMVIIVILVLIILFLSKKCLSM